MLGGRRLSEEHDAPLMQEGFDGCAADNDSRQKKLQGKLPCAWICSASVITLNLISRPRSEEQVRDVRGHFLVPVPLSCLVRHGSFSCLVVFVVVIVWLVLQPNTRSYENEAGDVVLTKHIDPVITGWWLSPTCSARCRHNSTPSRLASTSLPAMQESGPDEKEEAVRDY